jgi:hypothetical protein
VIVAVGVVYNSARIALQEPPGLASLRVLGTPAEVAHPVQQFAAEIAWDSDRAVLSQNVTLIARFLQQSSDSGVVGPRTYAAAPLSSAAAAAPHIVRRRVDRLDLGGTEDELTMR